MFSAKSYHVQWADVGIGPMELCEIGCGASLQTTIYHRKNDTGLLSGVTITGIPVRNWLPGLFQPEGLGTKPFSGLGVN